MIFFQKPTVNHYSFAQRLINNMYFSLIFYMTSFEVWLDLEKYTKPQISHHSNYKLLNRKGKETLAISEYSTNDDVQ